MLRGLLELFDLTVGGVLGLLKSPFSSSRALSLGWRLLLGLAAPLPLTMSSSLDESSPSELSSSSTSSLPLADLAGLEDLEYLAGGDCLRRLPGVSYKQQRFHHHQSLCRQFHPTHPPTHPLICHCYGGKGEKKRKEKKRKRKGKGKERKQRKPNIRKEKKRKRGTDIHLR